VSPWGRRQNNNMDYRNMEINQPILEGNEISRHGQRFLFEVFLENFISHKE